MSEFTNLPGHYVYKEDGNYAFLNTVAGDVTLILGTAPDGPYGMKLITDSQEAQTLYDPDNAKTGTLLKGMYEALQAGAKHVALYRIGASPAALDFFNGYTIIVDGDPADYKVYMADGKLTIYDATTGVVLYDLVNGTRTSGVTVSGSQIAAKTVGDTGTSWASSPTLASFVTLAGQTIHTAVKASNDALAIYFETDLASTAFKAGQIVKYGAVYYLVSYVTTVATKQLIYPSHTVNATTGALTAFTNITYLASAVDAEIIARLIDKADGLDMTPNQTYLALQRAYWDLESAQVDVVVPNEVYIDSPNVIDNEGVFSAQSALTHLGKAYKFETLGQIHMVFANASATVADSVPAPYELGIDGWEAAAWLEKTHTFDEIQNAGSDYETALENDLTFSEINFAQQLATYCYDLSANDNETSGCIGFKPFTSLSKSSVMSWLGKLPIKDADGTITRSGSGVLGNKLVAGSVGQSPGIFATANDLYGGVALISAQTNLPMDIGYLIDVVSTPILSNTVFVSGNGEITDGAAVYAGLLGKYEKNVPLMRKALPSGTFRAAYPFAKKYLDQLIEARTVAFSVDQNGITKVVDSPTASLVTSDYKSRFSVRVVQGVIDVVRSIAEPYLGSLTSPSSISNLQEDIISGLKALQTPGASQYLIAGTATVVQTAQQRIDGGAVCRLILKVPGELRRITTYVLLQK